MITKYRYCTLAVVRVKIFMALQGRFQAITGIILAWTLIMVSSACDKEAQSVMPKIHSGVLYVDPADVKIYSIDSFVVGPIGGCEYIPVPISNTSFYALDLDGDSLEDFRIHYRNFYRHQSNSTPCANYQSAVWVNSIDTAARVMMNHSLVKGDTLSHLMFSGARQKELIYHQDGYFIFKMANQSLAWLKYRYGYGLSPFWIEEYAINKHPADPLYLGQW